MKRMGMVVLCSFLLLILGACGGAKQAEQAPQPGAGGSSAPAAETPKKLGGKLVLYTSMQPTMLKDLEPLMQKALPGVQLEIFQAGTEKLVAKIAAEMEAGKVGADVLMVADPAYYLTLKQKNMLLPYKPANAQNVIGERDPDGYYTSVRVINTILGYNTKLVKPEEAPKKFSDLTDPKWKDSIAIVDPTLSGSAFDTVATLADKYGWEYFRKLKENGMQIVDGHGTLQSKLAAGEFKAVILLETNLLTAVQKGDPVQLVYPEDGIVMLPSPIGIISSTKNPEAAKVLVDWWFGPEAQGALATTNQHPVLPGYPSPQGARPINEIQRTAIPINWLRISDNYNQIKDDFAKVMK